MVSHPEPNRKNQWHGGDDMLSLPVIHWEPSMRINQRGKRAFADHEIDSIRREYAAGVPQSALSRKWEVAIGTIGRIVRGESYQRSGEAEVSASLTPELVPIDLNAPNANALLAERFRRLNPDIPIRVTGEDGPTTSLTPEPKVEKSAVDIFLESTAAKGSNNQLGKKPKGD